MKWFSIEKDGIPEKGKQCLVYNPEAKFRKVSLDYWDDLCEHRVTWGALVQIRSGEGWVENNIDEITHWCYVELPKD